MTRRSAPGKFVDHLQIEINPEDALRIKANNGDTLRITSRRGTVEGEAQITDRVPPQMVFLPFHFAEASANNLTASVWDTDSETPPFKISAVRVEKIAKEQSQGK